MINMILCTALYKYSKRAFSALVMAGLFVHATPSLAAKVDEAALIEGAKLCTRYLPRHERQYGIPEHLLAAIASSESGRFHRGLGLNLPWPWTINVNGRGYFFDTKEEAISAVNKLRADGYQSIDIGCMQVNLRHHPNAFASVEQAFDPAYNVGYAASFLKRNFMEEGSWRKATGDYHSRTPSYGESYAQRVFGAWGRIVSKVADARAGRPILTNYAKSTTIKPTDKPIVMASRVVRPSYRSLRMRNISVSSKMKTTTRENGVLVIRPQRNEEMILQVANAESTPLLGSKPSNVRITASPQPEKPVAALPSQGIKVVNVEKESPAKGQFEPKLRTATAGLDDATASSATAKSGNKIFIFDN